MDPKFALRVPKGEPGILDKSSHFKKSFGGKKKLYYEGSEFRTNSDS